MRFLHVCVCGPFTDGLAYQENALIEQHVSLGIDVVVVAATDTYGHDKKVMWTNPGRSRLACGAELIRLPYAGLLGGWLATKVRAHAGFFDVLEQVRPDRILFHGLTAWDLLTTSRYVERNPEVHLYADCHEDFNNSARTWPSRVLLHGCFYKPIFRKSVKRIREVLCVTVESLEFAKTFFGSPGEKTRVFPLGGFIEPEEIAARRRAEFRSRNNIPLEATVIAQTGKLDQTKRLNDALLAFRATASRQLRFVIAGQMTDDVRDECLPLIRSDSRVIDLGWQNADELRTVLSGVDCFLQPFGQTVTTQLAMCHGCAVLVQDVPSHRWLVGEGGLLFRDSSELQAVFDWVACNGEKISKMKLAAFAVARERLDYRNLAQQLLS